MTQFQDWVVGFSASSTACEYLTGLTGVCVCGVGGGFVPA